MIDPDALTAAVRAKIESLQAQLLSKVEANLSGDVLQVRSGALRSSISAALTAADGRFEIDVTSAGVPYAAIQEDGGETPPHEIVPVKAQALALADGRFARRVAHPGSRLPARRYMASALEGLTPYAVGGVKQAVRDALGAA